jgi:hypothetical protein
VKEFINYYINLGIDKIFIFDDNDINTEKISDMIEFKYKKYIKIYNPKKLKLFRQSQQFTFCYTKNKNKFDWILMVDMDEYLYIKKDKLIKNYLSRPVLINVTSLNFIGCFQMIIIIYIMKINHYSKGLKDHIKALSLLNL